MRNFVLIKTFKALPSLRPLIVSRNLYASSYLDSVNFQIQRRKLRHHDKNAEKSKMKIMKLYERMGVEGLYTESLQLLIHCVDPERYDDMSLLTQILIEDCKVDTVQDFLIKLGIKPCLHILKISIFSQIMSSSDLPKL